VKTASGTEEKSAQNRQFDFKWTEFLFENTAIQQFWRETIHSMKKFEPIRKWVCVW